MSGGSETADVKSNKNKVSVQQTEEGINLKVKKNYCYTCDVQCSGNKNFADHQIGRKHLKKLNSAQITDKNSKKKQIPVNKHGNNFKSKVYLKFQSQEGNNRKNAVKRDDQKFEESVTAADNSNYGEPNLQEAMNSETSYNSSANNKFINKQNFKNKTSFKNPYYTNCNSYNYNTRYHTPDYIDPNFYGNQQLYYNPPFQRFSNWNSVPPYNHNLVSYDPRFQGHRFIQNSDCLLRPSQVRRSWQARSSDVSYNFRTPSCNTVPNAEVSNVNSCVNQSSNVGSINEISEKSLFEFNSIPSHSKDIASRAEEFNEDVTSVLSKSALTDQSISHSDDRNCHNSQQLFDKASSSDNSVRKRIRSKSVSYAERICDNKKRVRTDSQNQSFDSHNAADEQKIKDWTNTLLETHHGQISRLINPSNSKDKAAVNHLITKLSKSKKKETLTKLKLQPDSSDLVENTDKDYNGDDDDDDDDDDDNNYLLEKIRSAMKSATQESAITTTQSEEMVSTQDDFDNEENTKQTTKKSKRRSSRSVDSERNSEPVTKSKKLDLLRDKNSEKSKTNKKTKNIQQNNCKQIKKIRNLNANTSKKSKVQQPSTTESLQESGSNIESEIHGQITHENLTISHTDTSESEKSNHILEDQNEETFPSQHGKVSCPRTNKQMKKQSNTATSSADSSSNVLPVKKERDDRLDANNSMPLRKSSGDTETEALSFNSAFTVETLIDLFASGSVKVKKEFNDPVIEAIKSVDPNELINACNISSGVSSEIASSKVCFVSSEKNLEVEPSNQETSFINETPQRDRNSLSPVIMGSLVGDNLVAAEKTSNRTKAAQNILNKMPCNDSGAQSPASLSDISKSTDNSLNFVEDCILPKDKSSFSPELKQLIKDLQEISSREEVVKHNLHEAKCKITDYHSLLEEWKTKKKKLQNEEEDLRIKRNEIIKLMQDSIKANENNEVSLNQTSMSSDNRIQPENISKECNMQSKVNESSSTTTTSDSDSDLSSPEKPSKQNTKKGKVLYPESDEITIIPVSKETKQPEVIVIDADDSPSKESAVNNPELRNTIPTNKISNDTVNLYYLKNLTAHSTVINCLLVFEDYLYTCSNDSTARRFSLKDPSNIVTYLHTAKNVTEVVVEIVQNDALVFTSCSNKVLSLFIASNGTKIASFFQPCSITSICKGWGKFYAGLANGSVNSYNWKYEEKEIIKTEWGASRLATAHQGRLHVLIILASNGNISLRDAETGLLIRYIKGFVKLPSWLAVNNDLAYLSSSDKTLTVLDIMSGRIEKKIYLTNLITGLDVYEENIFTISYSGVINCYNKEKVTDKKLFYGAGKSGLTCVHVYKDWVFTGNRKGDVSVFQFDPNSSVICQFRTCSSRFGLMEDLEFHVQKDHFSKKKSFLKCGWGLCSYTFPQSWNVEDKQKHVYNHMHSKL